MSLATLAEIGIKALRLQEATEKRRAARVALRAAYAQYKQRHCGGACHLEKQSDAYALMLVATRREYSAYEFAQMEVTAATRSLQAASKRAIRELKAGASAEAAVRRIMEKVA